jgi:hypothetical protein
MFGSMIEEETLQEEFDGLIVALEEMADGQPPVDLDATGADPDEAAAASLV